MLKKIFNKELYKKCSKNEKRAGYYIVNQFYSKKFGISAANLFRNNMDMSSCMDIVAKDIQNRYLKTPVWWFTKVVKTNNSENSFEFSKEDVAKFMTYSKMDSKTFEEYKQRFPEEFANQIQNFLKVFQTQKVKKERI